MFLLSLAAGTGQEVLLPAALASACPVPVCPVALGWFTVGCGSVAGQDSASLPFVLSAWGAHGACLGAAVPLLPVSSSLGPKGVSHRFPERPYRT